MADLPLPPHVLPLYQWYLTRVPLYLLAGVGINLVVIFVLGPFLDRITRS